MNALAYLVYGLLILCLATAESVVGLSLVMFKYMLYGTTDLRGGSASSGYSGFVH